MSVRITTEQAKLLFGVDHATTPRKPRVSKPRELLPENRVTAQIIDYLRLHGWVCTRRQSGLFSRPFDPASRIRIGEVGESDWHCERPHRDAPGVCDVFSVEIKGPGRTPKPEQLAWIRKRKALGFVAVWFDDFRSFQTWVESAWK